jgi:membrane protease YdiL (CAAX protease family)
MLCWGAGAGRTLILLPLLHWNPGLYDSLGFFEHAPALSSTNLLLSLFLATVLAPLSEELVFRGYLQNLFMHRWGLWPGILLSAFLFGLLHLQYAPFAMVTGVFFSLVYLKFGTLWPGTVLHALCNLLGTYLFFSNTTIFVKPRSDVEALSRWIPELLLTAAFIPLLILFWRRFRPAR